MHVIAPARETPLTRIGTTIMRSITLFANLGFGIVRTVLIFDQVEILGRCRCKLVSETGEGSIPHNTQRITVHFSPTFFSGVLGGVGRLGLDACACHTGTRLLLGFCQSSSPPSQYLTNHMEWGAYPSFCNSQSFKYISNPCLQVGWLWRSHTKVNGQP
jgi:hypothetical protein